MTGERAQIITKAAEVDPQQTDHATSIDQLAQVASPSAHTQRYDRQLRLWESSGQASLESANVLLVGASHLGAQVLKNLILPGIGAFTLLDGQRVTPFDIGNNFFLEPESAGHWRASEVARFLAELNPNVKCNSRIADPVEFLSASPKFLSSFSLIIAANQTPPVLRSLSEMAWNAPQGGSIPLLIVRGAGMFGEVLAQVKELGIVETHPNSTDDLRLTSPWPELSNFAATYDIDDKDAIAHSHIPFIVILLRRLHDWTRKHDGALPKPFKDRKAFVDSINALRDPANVNTGNFDEAIAALGQNVWRPISTSGRVPPDIEALFRDTACESVTEKSSNFWLLVRTLRDFVSTSTTSSPSGGGGHLPLPGSLPDFKATSDIYLAIRRLYKDKAQTDLQGFRGHLRLTLEKVGLADEAIPEDEVQSFAKHAGYLKLVRGNNYNAVQSSPAKDVAAMAFNDLVNPTTIQNHIAFVAIDRFYDRHGRFPGSSKAFSDAIVGVNRGCAGQADMNQPSVTSTCMNVRCKTPTTPRQNGEPERKRQKSESPFPPSTSSRTRCAGGSGAGFSATAAGQDDDEDEEMREASTALSTTSHSPECERGDECTGDAAAVDVTRDTTECLKDLEGILADWAIEEEEQIEAVRDAVLELVRSGHADIASTASLLGGVTAQEAIKLITRQYVPLEGVAVYDGIKQAIGTFRL